jgi:hypothetical protein
VKTAAVADVGDRCDRRGRSGRGSDRFGSKSVEMPSTPRVDRDEFGKRSSNWHAKYQQIIRHN